MIGSAMFLILFLLLRPDILRGLGVRHANGRRKRGGGGGGVGCVEGKTLKLKLNSNSEPVLVSLTVLFFKIFCFVFYFSSEFFLFFSFLHLCGIEMGLEGVTVSRKRKSEGRVRPKWRVHGYFSRLGPCLLGCLGRLVLGINYLITPSYTLLTTFLCGSRHTLSKPRYRKGLGHVQ